MILIGLVVMMLGDVMGGKLFDPKPIVDDIQVG